MTHIISSVDIRRRSRHLVLASIRSREAVRSRRGVVRAPVSATISSRGTDVRLGDGSDVAGEAGVDVVGVEGDLAVGGIAGHVLVEEGEDVLLGGLVVGENTGRAEETALLSGVEVELEAVLGGVFGVGQHAQGLEDGDGAGAVVVCSRRLGGG